VLASSLGRMNSEVLVPCIERVYDICNRNLLLPPPPPTLAAGGKVHIEFTGPLYQAQKKYHQVQGIETGMQLVAAMAQLLPNALDNVDEDQLIRIGLDSGGMPQKVIREASLVQEIRRKRAEAAAAQAKIAMNLEREKMAAGNADKLNQPLKPGSMLEGAVKAAAQGG